MATYKCVAAAASSVLKRIRSGSLQPTRRCIVTLALVFACLTSCARSVPLIDARPALPYAERVVHRGANAAERAALPHEEELRVRLQLARALLAEGEIDAALRHLQVVQRSEPSWFSYRLLYARVLLQGRADPAAAAEQARACVTLHDGIAECWVVLGDALRDLGRHHEAEEAYVAAIERGWAALALAPARARLAFARGNHDDAIERVTEALAHGEDVPLRLVRAQSHEALGDIERARRDYEHIAANHRDPLRGLRYLGAFYARHGSAADQARVAREMQRVSAARLPERSLRPLR